MKYYNIEPTYAWRSVKPQPEFVWRLYSEDVGLGTLDRCSHCMAPVPLAWFEDPNGLDGYTLCELCANTPPLNPPDFRANFAANMVLRKLGVFDEVRVKELDA